MPNTIPIISTRAREVWTYDNKRLLDRLAKLLITADVLLMLRCTNTTCPDQTIRMVKDDTDPAGRVLQCGCKNRQFEPAGLRKH